MFIYCEAEKFEKCFFDEDDSLKQGLADSMGRMQETILINESGLYNLIFASKMPDAKKIKPWVSHFVTPLYL
ncbi:MAG: BRO family protein [Oscillospiraceae bacterium]|nr:BRO family protein [Oscillospiraceae bacterium]